jgi:aminopeptidase-like protein
MVSSSADDLAEALEILIESYTDMLPYVDDYFREKWGYDTTLAEAVEVLRRHRT